MTIRSVVWAIDNNDQGAMPAVDARMMIGALLGASNNSFTTLPGAIDRAHGVCGLADLFVRERGAGANMSVDVDHGRAFIRSASGVGGSYFAWNDATVNLPLAAADGTNPRKDLIILHIRDTTEGDATDLPRLFVVTGTPNALATVPTDTVGDPSLAAYPRSLVLARVHVPAGDTSITNSQIVDYRRFIPTVHSEVRCTSTTRPTGFAGLRIFESDTLRSLRHDGTGWIIMSEPPQSYTPSWTNLTIGNGTTSGTFRRSNGHLNLDVIVNFGSTSAMGTTPTFTLPGGIALALNNNRQKSPLYMGLGGSAVTGGTFDWSAGATSIQLLAHVISGSFLSYQLITATFPFTWATGALAAVTIDHRMNTPYL